MRLLLNGRWPLELPDFRAEQWATPWEDHRLVAIRKHITAGTLVVDVGAETGDMGALFTSWGADTFLIEPSPYYWPTIRQTFEMNEYNPPSWFVGFAADTTDLHPPNLDYDATPVDGWPVCAWSTPREGFRHLAYEWDATPRARLDDLIDSCDIVTVDVEGSELAVLRGAERLLTDVRPVWFVSVHPTFMRDMYGHNARDLHALFAVHGYTGSLVDDTHEQHFVWEP